MIGVSTLENGSAPAVRGEATVDGMMRGGPLGMLIAFLAEMMRRKGDAMYSFEVKRISTLCFVLVAAIGFVGCSSAEPTDDPGVERVGKYLLMHKGPQSEVVVGYRFAQQSLGSDWLVLEMAMTSPPNQTAVMKRENVAVKTPAGETVLLATQREFNEAYGTLQSRLRAADVVRDPMNYWPPRKSECAIRFFTTPGTGVSFDEVTVNDFRACEGRLLFNIPGGVQAGRYILTIGLDTSEVEIPITFAQ